MKIKRYKSISLQWQLLYRFSILFLILFLGIGIYQYSSMKEYLYNSKVELLESRFRNIDDRIVVGTNTSNLLKKNSAYILEQIVDEDICAVIIDNNGKQIGERNIYTGIPTNYDNKINTPMSVPILSSEQYISIMSKSGMIDGYMLVNDEDGKEQIITWCKIGDIDSPIGLVQISTYTESVNMVLFEQIKVFSIAAIFILIIGVFLGSLLLKHTLNPLKEMTEALHNINTNELNFRLNNTTRQKEIDELSNSFNIMMERVEESFDEERKINEKMRTFIQDVSHEIRTPLTSIRGFIEVLQSGAAKSEKHLSLALNSMLMESERLTKLVNNLLLSIKIEENIKVEKESEDINNIIQEILPQLNILVGERKLNLSLGDSLYSLVNKDQIKQVIYNIVQNAINYTEQKHGVIKIETKSVSENSIEYIEIKIIDNGEGISEENLNLIFDRFFRGDKHRSRKKGGYGLGLSIVKSIVDNHGGYVNVESKVGRGSAFYIYLLKSK